MAEIDNVARVGISLDSAAFQDGVARTLRDIDRLLSGLKALQSANRQISLASGGLLGGGSKSPVAGFARDITRTAIPALRDMERNALRVNGAVRRSMQEVSRLNTMLMQADRNSRSVGNVESDRSSKLRRGQSDFMRKILEEAQRQGFRLEKTSGGHLQLVPPDKQYPKIFLGSTPSDRRAAQNFLTRLRNSGY